MDVGYEEEAPPRATVLQGAVVVLPLEVTSVLGVASAIEVASVPEALEVVEEGE